MLAVALLLAAGCSGGEKRAVPRRKAYPRIELPDTAMRPAEAAPLHFLVNGQTCVTSEKEGWLNVKYPTLGATMYVTFTRTAPAEIATVKANRMERLMLNNGGLPSKQSEFITPGGFRSLVAQTDGASTPIQFLATDDSVWVVSGAVYFSDPKATVATDSVRPMTEAITADIFRALNGLGE